MVYDASVAEATRLFDNKYHFAQRHIWWIGVGLLSMAAAARIPTSWLKKIGPPLFALTGLLLFSVLLPGVGKAVQGAQRWISVGSLSFQPSEFIKLSTVVYLASWLQKGVRPTHFFALIGGMVGMLMLQPDLGTAIVIAGASMLMVFVSGIKLQTFLAGVGIGTVGIAVLIVSSPYRLSRVKAFLDPSIDTQGSSYHISQALISFGSGGLFGLGLGRSRQKFQYLPEASTDSIFAILGEELGFIGGVGLLLMFVVFFYQLIRVASREQDEFRRLLATGLTGWLAIQTVINIGAMVALFPLTGVPLPFISYGGSSLISQLISVGVLMRISLTQK